MNYFQVFLNLIVLILAGLVLKNIPSEWMLIKNLKNGRALPKRIEEFPFVFPRWHHQTLDPIGELITTIAAHQNTVRGVSWNLDGQLLATSGEDKTIQLWTTDNLETLLTKGCNWLNSYLIGSPQVLQGLPRCQTPDRFRAAAPNLVNDSEALARTGKLESAIQGFTTDKQWDTTLDFDPIEKAKRVTK